MTLSGVAELGVSDDINKNDHSIFWYVDTNKLAIMSLVTCGLYEVFWLYKNWTYVQGRTAQKMLPFWRAWFGILWIWPLLKQVRLIGQESGGSSDFAAGRLALAFIALSFSSLLPGQLRVLSFFAWIPLLAVQEYINTLNEPLNIEKNSKLTVANWIGIGFGGTLTVASMLDLFLPHLHAMHFISGGYLR